MKFHSQEKSSKNDHDGSPEDSSQRPPGPDVRLLAGKENEPLKLICELTPCKRNSLEKSRRSSPPDSIIKNIAQFSPFFTTQTKKNTSPISPHVWGHLASQHRPQHPVAFEQLLHSESKPTALPNLRLADAPSLILDAFLPKQSYWETPRLEAAMAPPVNSEGFGCNCRNSRCLKLYCECFKKKQFCNGCNCIGCDNHSDSAFRREKVRVIEQKNPLAFQPNVTTAREDCAAQHTKGCNCRKSNCLKNYCECHQFGVSCGKFCKCKDCKNVKRDGKKLLRRVRKTKCD